MTTSNDFVEAMPGTIVISNRNNYVWFVISLKDDESYMVIFDKYIDVVVLERWSWKYGFKFASFASLQHIIK